MIKIGCGVMKEEVNVCVGKLVFLAGKLIIRSMKVICFPKKAVRTFLDKYKGFVRKQYASAYAQALMDKELEDLQSETVEVKEEKEVAGKNTVILVVDNSVLVTFNQY